MKYFDIVVVGAGPAGLAAAHAAAAQGAHVGIIDDNPYPGGQIWRGAPDTQSDPRAPQLLGELRGFENVEFLPQTRVMYAPQPQHLLVQTPSTSNTLQYKQLIIATGARERLLPFPGWTLPGVTGAGGLQALSKGGYPLEGKRVVVAGSGPLLLAAAATLKGKGAHIVAIIEQAATPALLRFGLGLLATPSKIAQALQLNAQLRGVPYWRNSYVHSAQGERALQSVQVKRGFEQELDILQCDYLACGYGLLPNVELAQALGCATVARDTQTVVQVDEWQQTSVPGVYCAGEGTGVGGVDLALAEGHIAGLSASGLKEQARGVFAARTRWRKFAERLGRSFALRPELRTLASDDTIVCRCEDVCHGDLRTQTSWRSAKLQTRCGMGPCQGRICGGATEVLYGWRPDAVRLPISPTRISSIID
ncbi:FAD-dependent oxidoreductase [Duganella sp. FT50W]|uniref:FAD-dependent oxidoreductase n=1 Tax=Duganella lactea TaxID=2692173 RepID=A0A6L8MMR6_9BURK|nr:FAD-dependent oxidoreductase [Duganella lactea]MYM83202.1 FAD-dependent oxidoreductase [Duganella lactea]